MTPFSSSHSRMQLGWVALGCAWLAALAWAVAGTAVGDEWVHWRQIQRFVRGDYRIFEDWLTNIPGYHWLLAAMLMPLGIDTLAPVRAVTACMALISTVLFYRIRVHLHPVDAQRSSALFFFLPTMFVYGYMAYTDVPALMFLLGAMLATLHGRHWGAAALLLASMAIRQNNVLWVGFLALCAVWPQWSAMWSTSTGNWRDGVPSRDQLQRWFAPVWPYVFAIACFCAYWAWNGSISYSTAQSQNSHPDFRPDIGNPVFLLAVAVILFPLQIVAGWKRLFAYGLRARGFWIWLLPLLVFGAYAWLFQVHHPFNFIVNANVRNQCLQLVAQGGIAWWMFGVMASWAFCGLAFQRYVVPQGWLWLPFSLLFVGASWMIETRYTIVPFVLFLALRRPEGAWAERVTLAGWIVLSGWLAWNVFDHRFML